MSNFDGNFWIDPENKKRGSLVMDQDGTFLLEVEGYLFWPEQLEDKGDFWDQNVRPENVVADRWPRTVLGLLDTGEPISLLGAIMQHLHGDIRFQRFALPSLVRGAHLHGRDDAVGGIRWRWRIPPQVAGWTHDSASRVEGDLAGVLSPWCDDRDAGLQLLLDQPSPLDATLTRSREYSSQLVALACFNAPPAAMVTEIRVNDEWREYEVPEQDPAPQVETRLIPLKSLTVPAFADWLPKADLIHPFPFMANSLTNILQLDAMILGTLLEGLHRRLYLKQRPLTGISNNKVLAAADTARKVFVDQLKEQGCQNPDVANKLANEALSHINEPNYHDRVMALVEPVQELVPSLFGPELSEWVDRTKAIRNAQSHQTLQIFDEEKIQEYYVFMQSCRWAVTLRMLLIVLPKEQVLSALRKSRSFHFALANIDQENLWPSFSALQSFRTTAADNGVPV
ncbi:HEPN domain-containing protein [Arthrobacter pityocampae]|uniref:HEPN domain-containing protein n=1 Tax=Arthrobacter pityocampae TaxID=547334 RepID=UPI003735AFAB